MPSPGRVKSSHRITAAIEDVAACQAGTRGRSVLPRALHEGRCCPWACLESRSEPQHLGATEQHVHTRAAPGPGPNPNPGLRVPCELRVLLRLPVLWGRSSTCEFGGHKYWDHSTHVNPRTLRAQESPAWDPLGCRLLGPPPLLGSRKPGWALESVCFRSAPITLINASGPCSLL